MSGRIEADRPGFNGYECIQIPILEVDCTDCDGNSYLRIPVIIEGVTENTGWSDYQDTEVPSTIVPTIYDKPCQDNFEQGFLEVEFPDVPPVSVRGISLYNRGLDGQPPEPPDVNICTLCWEYDRTDPDDVRAFYWDWSDVEFYPEGDDFKEIAKPKTYRLADLSDRYLEQCEIGDESNSSGGDPAYAAITFVHCTCEAEKNIFTRKVITDVFIDGGSLKYRYEEWKFDGGRLIEINDLGVCETTEEDINTEAALATWESIIVGISDCP